MGRFCPSSQDATMMFDCTYKRPRSYPPPVQSSSAAHAFFHRLLIPLYITVHTDPIRSSFPHTCEPVGLSRNATQWSDISKRTVKRRKRRVYPTLATNPWIHPASTTSGWARPWQPTRYSRGRGRHAPSSSPRASATSSTSGIR